MWTQHLELQGRLWQVLALSTLSHNQKREPQAAKWPGDRLEYETRFPTYTTNVLFTAPSHCHQQTSRPQETHLNADLPIQALSLYLGLSAMILKWMTKSVNKLEGKINGSKYLPWYRSNQWNIANKQCSLFLNSSLIWIGNDITLGNYHLFPSQLYIFWK